MDNKFLQFIISSFVEFYEIINNPIAFYLLLIVVLVVVGFIMGFIVINVMRVIYKTITREVREIRWDRYLDEVEGPYRKPTYYTWTTKEWEEAFYKTDAQMPTFGTWGNTETRLPDNQTYQQPKRQTYQQTNKQASREKQITYDVDPFNYEKLCANHFQSKGYTCALTPKSGDYGADIIATDIRNGKKIAIQCKFYGKGHKVGIKAVQEVISAKQYYKCNEAWVVSNSVYTAQAEELAEETGVELKTLVVKK